VAFGRIAGDVLEFRAWVWLGDHAAYAVAMRLNMRVEALVDAAFHTLTGHWWNADTREFYDLRAENGLMTAGRDFMDRPIEVFVVTTGSRQGIWQKVS
jgi:hypothetical protein